MNIRISVREVKELLLHVLASDASSRLDTRKVLCDTLAGRGAGHWVSHTVADPAKEPPSVMTVATTESTPVGGADMDLDKEFVESAGEVDSADAYGRADAVASFIIKNLLDFEAWLDGRLSNDDEATVERVRFHAEVSYDGRSITMRHLTEYRNADRCKVPRVDGRIRKWAVPTDDDALEDFEAGAVRSCVSWVCGELGIDIDEYIERDGKAGGAKQHCGHSGHHDVCGDITEESMVEAADEEAAYVYGIVNGRLSALEAWVESKVCDGGISAFVTVFGDTVKVRIDDLGDMERGPLMLRETKVGTGHDKHSCVTRIISEAYSVVFGRFEGLSLSEFLETVSVATDGK